MKLKKCLFSLLVLPLLGGCNSNSKKGDFFIGSSSSKVMEIGVAELSGKMFVQNDTFLLATHSGDSCTCWTGFQYVIEQYNESRKEAGKEYIPFFSFDTNLYQSSNEIKGIDKVLSGYVDLYVIVEGEIVQKYTKSAKKDYDIFDKPETLGSKVEKYIKSEPIKNYSYITYECVRANLINKEEKDFVLIVVRSGCKDCSYCIPNVLTPWIQENGSKLPIYICDIESFKDQDEYTSVKNVLNITSESSSFGFDNGYVPTYQCYKNGQIVDAGVYLNDTFTKDESGKVEISKTYFDGTRDLKYTNANLLEQYANESNLEVIPRSNGNGYYMEIKKAAVFHDPLLKSFLSYYCK